MSAPTPAEVAKGLRELADRVELTGLVPSPNWPLVFRAPDRVCKPEGVQAVAESLGVAGGETEGLTEEDGLFWYRLRGHVGAVVVDVTADGGPVLLDPLTDEGAIVRSWAAGDAL
jgi:hypothetical protein